MKKKIHIKYILSLLFVGTILNLSAQVVEQDSLALVALYNSTDGANWTNNENWLTGPVNTWHGITVWYGHVENIHLSANNLSGIIPAELGNLANLTYLIMYNNHLTGAIPPELGNLVSLTHLHLYNNQLTGSIPTELGNPPNLQNLLLYNNQLSGSIPAELGNLTYLTSLALGHNQLTGTIPGELGNLSYLTSLSLLDNQLTDAVPSELGNLTNLKWLHLQNNNLNDLPDLSTLSFWSAFEVSNNHFTFEDIEPNIRIPGFVYAPQDSVGEAHDITVAEGESLNLTVTVGGIANQYQWFHDGIKIDSAEDSVYTLNAAALSDIGAYSCQITNTIATDLTLYSRPVNVHITPASSVADQSGIIPDKFALLQNYPNPFNPETIIQYHVAKSCDVILKIYNVTGQEIITLVNDYQNQGEYEVRFKLNEIPSGIYFYKIQMNDYTEIRKMMKIE